MFFKRVAWHFKVAFLMLSHRVQVYQRTERSQSAFFLRKLVKHKGTTPRASLVSFLQLHPYEPHSYTMKSNALHV